MNIGLIGCGRIACEAHLPAYKKYGIPVAGVCDLIEERAKKAAEEYEIGFYTTDAKKLAEKEEVELLDIATRPLDRTELLRSLLPYQKPILVQKPVCYEWEEAVRLDQEFKKWGVSIAVNHNARWAPLNLKVKESIESGELGKIYALHHINRFNENISAWYTDYYDYLFLDHGLHYIDLVRWYTNRMPTAVSALSSTRPSQQASCPLLYSLHFQYLDSPPLLVSLFFNNAVLAPCDFHCEWFIDGTEGSIRATIDSLSKIHASGKIEPMRRIEGDWVPEGFLGSYKEFITSIEQKISAPHALADHIFTLKIASAAATSAREGGQWVQIPQI